MKKRIIHHNIMIPANYQAAIISQPGKGSLHFPASFITPQFATIVIFLFLIVAPVRANQLHTTPRQAFPKRVAVIGLVRNNSLRFFSRATTAFPGDGNLVYRFFEQRDFRRGRRVQVVSQRNTLAVDHHHPLRTFAPFGLSDAFPPFLAGAKLPSTNASDQSSCPRSSSSARNARQALSQTSCSSQRFNRRQHVEGLGYRLGKSAHGAPVRKIHKIPSNTLRLSAQGLPPRFDFLGWGNKGSSFFHCSFVNFHRSLAIEKLLSMTIVHKSLYGASLNCTLF